MAALKYLPNVNMQIMMFLLGNAFANLGLPWNYHNN